MHEKTVGLMVVCLRSLECFERSLTRGDRTWHFQEPQAAETVRACARSLIAAAAARQVLRQLRDRRVRRSPAVQQLCLDSRVRAIQNGEARDASRAEAHQRIDTVHGLCSDAPLGRERAWARQQTREQRR